MNDCRLKIFEYKLVRADVISSNYMSDAGISFKVTLAVQPVPIDNLKECLQLEFFDGNKTGFAL